MKKARRVLGLLGSALTSSVLLAACTGTPHKLVSESGGSTEVDSRAAARLETDSIRLGFLPILEAVPLVVAVEKGFCARQGLTVELARQPNWPAALENVVIGARGGGIDGGQWQLPMPHLISEGIITGGRKVPMYVLAQLNSQGNAIAVSNSLRNEALGLDLTPRANRIRSLPDRVGRRFRAAHTYPHANQDLWIRYWLAAGGVDPDRDIQLLSVSSTETLQGLRNGTMDAFSTGDPWPFRIVADDIGYIPALTAQIWAAHPEEFLAVRSEWVDRHPKATMALLKCVMQAQQWADEADNRAEVAKIMSLSGYLNTPRAVLKPALQGRYLLGADRRAVNDPRLGPLYWTSDRGVISYPYKSLSLWFLVESLRWKFHPGQLTSIEQARALVDRVNREDLWQQAARELGVPESEIPTGSSRGKETFFDGKVFDPENPQAYLDSLTIKR